MRLVSCEQAMGVLHPCGWCLVSRRWVSCTHAVGVLRAGDGCLAPMRLVSCEQAMGVLHPCGWCLVTTRWVSTGDGFPRRCDRGGCREGTGSCDGVTAVSVDRGRVPA